ncbi:MAG TPA: hypothetical protein VMU84_07310 [Thermoanaerobaculia bacterium]|nr:hypothetical protein [Thermoanaerobaculia bacterium]
MSTVRKSYFGCAGLLTERDARNLRIFNTWMMGTLVLWAGTTILIERHVIVWPIGWGLTLASFIACLRTTQAYIRFMRDSDELLRKIQLEGLAFAFAGGVVFMLIWRLCERLGAPKLDCDDPFLVMMLCWALGQYLGTRRYASTEP